MADVADQLVDVVKTLVDDPEQVELEVTDRLELALQQLKQLDYLESYSRPGLSVIRADSTWRTRGTANPYVTEHVDLIASIRGRTERLNEAERGAESTLTAIMGRMTAS